MIDVLYVEDNPNDADIFSRLIRKLSRPVSYIVLDSGTEAIDYLTEQGQYKNQKTQLPKLVLMDLNLGGISGLEVIEKTRSCNRTRFLPIVAFSTSDNPKDVESAYQMGVNAYVVKPGNYQGTGAVISRMCDFWLENNIGIDRK